VTTLAGRAGSQGFANGYGSDAIFNDPRGLAIQPGTSVVFVADTLNHCIRRVSAQGLVTTVAGVPGQPGLRDGRSMQALFDSPRALSVDAVGNVYVADTNNSRIRLLTADGNVITLAGQGSRAGGGGGAGGGTDGAAEAVKAGAVALTNPAGLSIDLYLQNFEADMRWRRRRRRRSSSRRLLAG